MIKPIRGGYDIATYTTVCKGVVTALLVVWYFGMPELGFTPSGTIGEYLLWPLSHANIWHLAGNVYFLWFLKGRLYMRECYLVAVICSFLPVWPGLWELMPDADATGTVATCGFSGVLCAMVGVKWGEWIKSRHSITAYWTFAKRVLPFVAVGFLIPHVNWSIHLYCLILGLAYGRWE